MNRRAFLNAGLLFIAAEVSAHVGEKEFYIQDELTSDQLNYYNCDGIFYAPPESLRPFYP